MAYPSGMTYHADSDADDEYERSVMTSPTQVHTDSETSSDPPSNEHTPTTFDVPGDDSGLPRTIITEWTPEECAQFVSSLNLRQYCQAFVEHGIEGEALVALKHDELKEMGIASVGHRLTILKNVYDMKVNQDIPFEPDDYVPPTAEQNPQHEMATKEDIQRLARSILRLRDERIAQAEAQLTRLADDYRKLRQELLPVFKMSKERSEPLPYAPYQNNAVSPEIYQQDIVSPPVTTQPPPEKTSLTRTFSKKLGLSSTPKNNSPTHIPSTIHEGRTFNTENGGLDPSAAASLASNSLTAQMSGGALPHPSPGVPSPTSPLPYQHQPLAARSYQREGSSGISAIPRYDGTDDRSVSIERDRDPPTSAKSVSAKLNPSNSTISGATTLVPSREMSASVPPQLPSSAAVGHTPHNRDKDPPSGGGGDAPSVEIFKSFRVGLEDPCYKVLPAALRKYNIQADWRQYALYIVYGDQERCVGLEEKPLALFKDLDREGKKPMFMLRKLANPMVGEPVTAGIGMKPPIQAVAQGAGVGLSGGSAAAGMRPLPGGVL
ncbi:protein kinase regulator Ste50 [Cladophialophora carrionii]|uniref:Protein kinase regulator Ste50 n=1 Tax=Cladophialophora carrionii TaxID=86049 RepID=A0A1C1C8A6_9EURO|nr:protein kinase regulator Ste50 [Cladophialophora carrionii]